MQSSYSILNHVDSRYLIFIFVLITGRLAAAELLLLAFTAGDGDEDMVLSRRGLFFI